MDTIDVELLDGVVLLSCSGCSAVCEEEIGAVKSAVRFSGGSAIEAADINDDDGAAKSEAEMAVMASSISSRPPLDANKDGGIFAGELCER